MKLAIGGDKTIEIGQFGVEGVADAFDCSRRGCRASRRDGRWRQLPCRPGRRCMWRRGGAFLASSATLWAGGEPEFSGARVAAKTLAGRGVDHPGDVVGSAGCNLRGEGSGPADGDARGRWGHRPRWRRRRGWRQPALLRRRRRSILFFSTLGPELDASRVEWGQPRTRGFNSPGMAAMMAMRVMPSHAARSRWRGTTRWRRAWRGRRGRCGSRVPAGRGRRRQTSSCGPCGPLRAWRAALCRGFGR